VFVMPDHCVLLKKLHLVKRLTTLNIRLTIIIAHSVLVWLDRNKKESSQAREAIRWLESAIPKGRVRMSNSPLTFPTSSASSTFDSNELLVAEGVQFLTEKGLLDRHTVFAAILVTDLSVKEIQYTALTLEDADSFVSRMVAISESANP